MVSRLALLSLAFVSVPVGAQVLQYPTPDLTGYLPRTEANQFMDETVRAHEILYPDIVLAQTAVVAISAGPRQLNVSIPGCVPGNRMIMTPTEATPPPAGVMLGDIRCQTPGNGIATLNVPLLAIGQGYSFSVRVTEFR